MIFLLQRLSMLRSLPQVHAYGSLDLISQAALFPAADGDERRLDRLVDGLLEPRREFFYVVRVQHHDADVLVREALLYLGFQVLVILHAIDLPDAGKPESHDEIVPAYNRYFHQITSWLFMTSSLS